MGNLLVRHLDLDVIRRMRAGIKAEPKPSRSGSKPRRTDTYRAARRNAWRERGVVTPWTQFNPWG